MKKHILILIFILTLPACAKTITGEISKELNIDRHQVIDSQNNIPIEGVIIKIPSKNFQTKTRKDGTFDLKTQINSPTIMTAEKSGYKPYSLTLNEIKSPIQVSIEKTTPKDIIVDTQMIHIGDNSFSPRSANADDFSIFSSGPFYSKDFKINLLKKSEELFLVIGSIIGIDTHQAQKLGQSKVLTAHSSPPEIFFNGNKIAEIKINGDNQKIKIPFNLIKHDKNNNLTIKSGKNLFKTTSIDFDDIEFTNIFFEIK
ncbi:MAG: carboxypeptidase-like regulatory domain-containing protein [Cyanobacteria bacterium SIG29]|nr:carboxypeptidase-like regulatory domain-containing protein [Cyanobacteria bacterium SIG29]